MAKVLIILLPFVAIALLPVYFFFFKSPPPLPEINQNAWWGLGEPKEDTTIRPFKVKFTDAVIKDLKDRLKNHRPFTPPLQGVAFEYGFNTNTLESWISYWQETYNFTERENFLNQHPQFKTKIQGLDIHFIRVTSQAPEGKKVLPILLLHGWPGSVREFYEAIPLLTAVSKDRDFVLELIIPSLPGYGFSEGSSKPGLGPVEVSVINRNLMQRLGFKQYYVQGGDWGSLIASNIATLFPKEVLGYHANMFFLMSPAASIFSLLGSYFPSLVVDSKYADRMYPLSEHYSYLIEESGYMHIQSTKPDTVGISLLDSPSGLMAYILEKFSTWSRKEHRSKVDGGLEFRFKKDQLIDNLMIYWTTRSITTSMRFYAESSTKKNFALKMDEIPTTVPTWALLAKYELAYLPPWIIKFKYPNLLNAVHIEDGGHFLAFELPQVFSEDILKAVQAFREWNQNNNVKTDL